MIFLDFQALSRILSVVWSRLLHVFFQGTCDHIPFCFCASCHAYGAQLQRRVVGLAEQGCPVLDIHTLWCPLVAVATIRRWIRFKRLYGHVPTEVGAARHPRLSKRMPSDHVGVLTRIVRDHPDLYVDEIAAALAEETNHKYHKATVLRREGFTHRRLHLRAKQRDEMLRTAFLDSITGLDLSCFIFVDETHCNARTGLRRFGWIRRGMGPPISLETFAGKQFTLIAAINSSAGFLEDESYRTHCR